MFNAEINSDVLTEFIDYVSVVDEEIKLDLTGGFKTRCVDPANVLMTEIHVDSESFDSFESEGVTLGVDISKFDDIASFSSSDDMVEFDYNERVQKLNLNTGGLEYTLSLISLDAIREQPNIPNLNLSAEIVINSDNLNNAVSAADMVGSQVTLGTTSDDEFYVESSGDTDDVERVFSSDELISIDSDGSYESLYSLKYLNDVSDVIPSDTNVTIRIGNDFPIFIEVDLKYSDGEVIFVLAPRIG